MEDDKNTLPPAATEAEAPAAPDQMPEQAAGRAGAPSSAEEEAKRQEHLEHLRNVQRIRQGKTEVAHKQSLLDSVMESIDNLKRKRKQAAAAEGDAKVIPDIVKATIALSPAQKKKIKLGIIAVVVLAIVGVLAPFIPVQIQRSAGFAAFQEGDYETAMTELMEYQLERPNDYEASHVLAQAAMFLGNVDSAREIINRLYMGKYLPNSLVSFHYALINPLPADEALAAVDEALAYAPDAVAPTLLRGILLGLREETVRESREEFLQVTKAIRTTRDFGDMLLLHRYIQSQPYLGLALSSIPQVSGDVPSALSRWLVPNMRLDGFSYRFKYSNAQILRDETLSAVDIANYYFVDMLLRQNELQEAASILDGLQRSTPDSLVVAQLAAIGAVVSGDYAAAKEQFTRLLERLPGDSITINNLATAELLGARDAPGNALPSMLELYRSLLDVINGDPTAFSNGAYIALISGDVDTAQALFSQINDQGGRDAPKTELTRALLALSLGEEEAAMEIASKISWRGIPNINDYRVAIRENQGDFAAAINLFDAADSDYRTSRFHGYLRLLYKQGEWGFLVFEGDAHLKAHPEDGASRYYVGLAALALKLPEMLEENRAWFSERADDEEWRHYGSALEGAIARQSGDVAQAAALYREAMNSPNISLRQQHDYIMAWARNAVREDAAAVASTLSAQLDRFASPLLRSVYAYALSQGDNYELAEDEVRAALEGGQGYIVNLYAGLALAGAGLHSRAIPFLLRANEIWPAREEVAEALKIAYLGTGDSVAERKAEALQKYLAQVAAGNPPRVNASYKIYLPSNNARISQKVQEVLGGSASYGEATKAYEEEIAKESSNAGRADLLYSQATFEVYHKANEKAARFFGQALALGLGNRKKQVDATLFYAEVLSFIGDYNRILKLFDELINLDGSKLLYERSRAKALIGASRSEEARAAYDALLGAYPATPQLYYDLAELYIDLSDFDTAIATVKTLLRAAPAELGAYNILAELYLAKKDQDTSLKYNGVRDLLERQQL